MKFNPDFHHRHSIRLQKHDYSSPGYYFITMCSFQKEHLFGKIRNGNLLLNRLGNLTKTFWLKIEQRFLDCRIDTCIVMPNHVHVLIEIQSSSSSTHQRLTRASSIEVKSNFGKESGVGAIHELPLYEPLESFRQANRLPQRRKMTIPIVIGFYRMNVSKLINEIRNSPGVPVLQRNYYEHVVRDLDELFSCRTYIQNNPLNWEQNPEYSGSGVMGHQ